MSSRVEEGGNLHDHDVLDHVADQETVDQGMGCEAESSDRGKDHAAGDEQQIKVVMIDVD